MQTLQKNERDASDLELAKKLGEKYGPSIWNFVEAVHLGDETSADISAAASGFVKRLFEEVAVWDAQSQGTIGLITWMYSQIGTMFGQHEAFPGSLTWAHADLASQFEHALRIFKFFQNSGGGVLVSTADPQDKFNELSALPLFDALNPFARALLGSNAETIKYPTFENLQTWVEVAAHSDAGVAFVAQETASKGFVTLFTNSVRAVWEAVKRYKSDGKVDYTFHSKKPGGYKVLFSREFYISPVTFGPKLSTPVTKKDVLSGNYYFYGQLGNDDPIPDRTPFNISPAETSGTTNVF